MKNSLKNARTITSIAFKLFVFAIALVVVTFALRSTIAQPVSDNPGAAAAKPVNQNAPDDRPPSMKENVQVMVELSDAPAAIPYAEAMKEARKQADAAKNPKKIELSSAAAATVKSHAQRLDQTQQGLLPSLTGGKVNGRVLYRVQKTYNGIALTVSPKSVSEIAKLPGVKAVHPLHPKYPSATFSDIDFLRTRTASGGPWSTGNARGEGIRIADIDSGLDFVHANFGGNGNYTGVTDTNANGHFPNAKVPGGFDFAGDAYNANVAGSMPNPDPIPWDGSPTGSAAGHGTATASLIAGFGENNDGTTYTDVYDASHPSMSSLKISPGFAPKALLYPLRVFGNSGSSNLITAAIEWAMDPNGDDDMSDHMDVINMSLGSNEGYPDDPDAVAAANASAIGVIVCSAAGNAGDTYYIHSSPASARGTLSIAASFNDQSGFVYDSSITPHTNAGAGSPPDGKYKSIYGSPCPHVGASGLTGNVVYAVPANGGNEASGVDPVNSNPFSNAANISGNICMANRGTSSFVQKAAHAQASGAVALIIVNETQPTADPIIAGLTGGPAITIPVIMISKIDGDAIRAAAGGFDATTGLPANSPVNVTINNDNGVISHSGTAADTMPSYSSRGPGLPDSALKPDVTAPAEVVGVATNHTGTAVSNFNGTSSATPHVSGAMALLRQLHPSWSVQELNALICETATHNLIATTAGGGAGVGRVGAGRIDLTNAASTEVVAYNGSDADQIGVSFGVVETPVNGNSSLSKNITVVNKGAGPVTYNLSILNNPSLPGAVFTVTPSSITVPAGSTATVAVQLDVNGNLLKHRKEAGVSFQLPAVVGRQWLTEASGYVQFAPTAGSSTPLRVGVYAAPKPVSAMHTTAVAQVVKAGSTGTVNLPLAGTPVNTGTNYGFGFDIIGLVKPFELQYARTGPSTDPNVIKYVGVMSDFGVKSNKPADAVLVFGIEGFGNAPVPEFNSSDKEVYIDINHDGTFDFAIFLSSIPNGTAHSNEYRPILVDLKTGVQTPVPFPYETNLLDPVFNPNGSQGGKDTNAFNNSSVLIPVPASMLTRATSSGLGAPTQLKYIVATFDRNGNEVDETPLLTYDYTKPGLNVAGGHAEPFYYNDLTTTTIPVQYDSRNFKANGTLGAWLVHRHNGDGLRSDVVPFTTK